METLPYEMLEQVLLNTHSDDLYNLSKTDKKFNELYRDNRFRKKYLKRHFIKINNYSELFKYIGDPKSPSTIKLNTEFIIDDIYEEDIIIAFISKDNGFISLPDFIGPALWVWEKNDEKEISILKFKVFHHDGYFHRLQYPQDDHWDLRLLIDNNNLPLDDIFMGNDYPAFINYNTVGHRDLELYYNDGILDRPSDQGPAVTEKDPTGKIIEQRYIVDGYNHRSFYDGPAIVSNDGNTIREEYWTLGERHRLYKDGPAFLEEVKDGPIYIKSYYFHGMLYRPWQDGPADYMNFNVKEEIYTFDDGVLLTVTMDNYDYMKKIVYSINEKTYRPISPSVPIDKPYGYGPAIITVTEDDTYVEYNDGNERKIIHLQDLRRLSITELIELANEYHIPIGNVKRKMVIIDEISEYVEGEIEKWTEPLLK